jgi:hypothetical protein
LYLLRQRAAKEITQHGATIHPEASEILAFFAEMKLGDLRTHQADQSRPIGVLFRWRIPRSAGTVKQNRDESYRLGLKCALALAPNG